MTTAVLAGNVLAWSAQAALVIAAGAWLPRLLRVQVPAVRHAYWRLLLVACLALPVLQPWHPALPLDVGVPALQGDAAPEATEAGKKVRLPREREPRPASIWPIWLLAVLGGGAAARLVWLRAGLVRLRGLRQAGAPAGFGDEIPLTPVTRRAEIRFVGDLRQPVTFGIFSPVVLLPSSLITQPPGIQRAVLVHELWHVERRDWAWSVSEEILRAVFWFHPFVWWLISRVQSTREEVVDALTVASTESRRTYLEALLLFADEPSVSPAAPFAERRHLFHRMLLISREAVMSSRRILASCVVMVAVVVSSGWYGAGAFPFTAVSPQSLQSPPRDQRPPPPQPPPAPVQAGRSEAELQAAIRAEPSKVENYYALAAFYKRAGDFDRTIATLEDAAALAPSNPASYHLIATHYWEKANKDQSLSPGDRLHFIQAGIAADDRALELNPDYSEALVYKNILLRMQANLSTDPAERDRLIREADRLRNRALELRGTQSPTPRASGSMPPPPPPPPPPAGSETIDGLAPIRVGGNIAPPVKVKDVRPVYPEDAKAAGVQGVVILEIRISTVGTVVDTRVLRSILQLDQAAIDAVRQWEFAPTLLNGRPVPVIMTVTVNFTLQ